MNDPNIAEKIALWYRTLHQTGRDYVNTHDILFTSPFALYTPIASLTE